ncbi:aminotransferase class IV [Clostridiaceae bacterium M8S5]|nr:aminotransferase class IV [Clostridiaceae bacterium M8S5]
MKNESYKELYIYNDIEYKQNNDEGFIRLGDKCIYEVIRLIDKKPLFLEEHIERLNKSVQLLGHKLNYKLQYFKDLIERLVKINKCENINVKIFVSGFDNNKENILICCIKSYYPEQEVYQKGIKTILVDVERENPNIKSMNTEFKKGINEKLQLNNAFEALIVNHNGYITEGSRSNIFFVKNNSIYTSISKDVLLGVTRNHIIGICKKLRIPIVEENVYKDDLADIDGVFMTGTSVGVLPIAHIDGYDFKSPKLDIINKISLQYKKEIKDYLQTMYF